MTEVYLITGFLGAGKTCFVKNMVKALPHETMDIIVNEFGREGIDGALLHKTGLQVKEIVNGSIFVLAAWISLKRHLLLLFPGSLRLSLWKPRDCRIP